MSTISKGRILAKIAIVFLQNFLAALLLLVLNLKGFVFWSFIIIMVIFFNYFDDYYLFPKIFRENIEKFDVLKEVEKCNEVKIKWIGNK